MRMSITVARLTVCRPAGMSDAGTALEFGGKKQLQLADLALALVEPQRAITHHGETGRVIAAVLEPVQTFQQNWRGVLPPNVSHDSTHPTASTGAAARNPRRALIRRSFGESAGPCSAVLESATP